MMQSSKTDVCSTWVGTVLCCLDKILCWLFPDAWNLLICYKVALKFFFISNCCQFLSPRTEVDCCVTVKLLRGQSDASRDIRWLSG